MSTTAITSPFMPKCTFFTPQWEFPFSLKTVLKTLFVVGAILQSGATPVSANQIRVLPVKMPEYCASRNQLAEYGYPFSFNRNANVFCFLQSKELFQSVVKSETGEARLLAEYTLGKRLACPEYPMGPPILNSQEALDQAKKVEEDKLEGLALMYRSGYLNVLIPEKGETFEECIHRFERNTPDIWPINYLIDGCRYFVSGTLICPDQDRFDCLKERFLGQA